MSNSFVAKLPKDKIAAFCERWKITELALFSSILRDDFLPDSDVDVLVRSLKFLASRRISNRQK